LGRRTSSEVNQILLHEVGVVLDLQSLREVLGVALNVQKEGSDVVADAEGLHQTLLIALLHGVVGVLERSLAGRELVVLVEKAGWVADGGVDILERDREVDDVEIEVLKAPIRELLLEDWLDALLVVERVP